MPLHALAAGPALVQAWQALPFFAARARSGADRPANDVGAGRCAGGSGSAVAVLGEERQANLGFYVVQVASMEEEALPGMPEPWRAAAVRIGPMEAELGQLPSEGTPDAGLASNGAGKERSSQVRFECDAQPGHH